MPRAPSFKRLKETAVAALEDIKARDILVLDVRKRTSMFDCIIIATAESARQTKALARNVMDKLALLGRKPLSTEGEDTGEWVLVDFGDLVVHVMQPAIRAHYNLEELWAPKATLARPRTERAPAKPAPTTQRKAATPAPRARASAARKAPR